MMPFRNASDAASLEAKIMCIRDLGKWVQNCSYSK
jgi:hypothetical protein